MSHEWKIGIGTRRADPRAMNDFNVLTFNGQGVPGDRAAHRRDRRPRTDPAGQPGEIRNRLTGDGDPGWYESPADEVASEATDDELARDGIAP
jgi:hypothetical protein